MARSPHLIAGKLRTRVHLQCQACQLDGYGWSRRAALRDLAHSARDCADRAHELEQWRRVGEALERKLRALASEEAKGPRAPQPRLHRAVDLVPEQGGGPARRTLALADSSIYRHAGAGNEPSAASLDRVRAMQRLCSEWQVWRALLEEDTEWSRQHRKLAALWSRPGHFRGGDRISYNWPGVSVELVLPAPVPAVLTAAEVPVCGFEVGNVRHTGPDCGSCRESLTILRERRRIRTLMRAARARLEAELTTEWTRTIEGPTRGYR